MHGISKILMLLALSQLGACAVMSKTECLNADWRNVGYDVGLKGKTDVSNAFNRRSNACVKHGANADWGQFRQGHSDGVVEYCQLGNAVDLGVRGVRRAINDDVCPERDYPGFREAFNAGYQLHILSDRVRDASVSVSRVTGHIHESKKRIDHIKKELGVSGLDADERKRLKRERRQLRYDISQLERDLVRYQQYLYKDRAAKNDYADFLYQEYIEGLSNEFVDPREKVSFDDRY